MIHENDLKQAALKGEIERAYSDGYRSGFLGGSNVTPYWAAVYQVLAEEWHKGYDAGEGDRKKGAKKK